MNTVALRPTRFVAVCMGLALMALGAFAWTGADARDRSNEELGERLQLMARSLRIARAWHVNNPTKRQLIEGGVKGMLRSLDPEADYYSASELRRYARAADPGQAGVEARREPAPRRGVSPGFRIISSRDGSAAAVAGLKAGDLVSEVDGKQAGEMSYLAFLASVSGIRSSDPVVLTVKRAGSSDEGESEIILHRVPPVGSPIDIDEPEPGVIRVRMVAVEPAAVEMIERELGLAVAQFGARLRGVVIDLRGTAEGAFDVVPRLADIFLERGKTLVVATRRDREGSKTNAGLGDLLRGRPLTVLIDGGTAGPAEALASALKDNHRARLIGEKSAGRGNVRELVGVDRRRKKGAVRIVTARLIRPNGEAIEGNGLVPDVAVTQAPADTTCRSLDIRSRKSQETCSQRQLVDDSQLRMAITHLAPAVAAKVPGTGKRANDGAAASQVERP